MEGCSDKVLCLKWHPFFDYILASGSADNSVKVWDIKNVSIFYSSYLQENGHKNLEYHKSRVRSVSWNYEIPWLLISAGDDSYFGVWDIR